MAPGSGRFGEVRRAIEPRERECADARGGSRRAALNAGLGAMFAAQVGGILADRRSERDPSRARGALRDWHQPSPSMMDQTRW